MALPATRYAAKYQLSGGLWSSIPSLLSMGLLHAACICLHLCWQVERGRRAYAQSSAVAMHVRMQAQCSSQLEAQRPSCPLGVKA